MNKKQRKNGSWGVTVLIAAAILLLAIPLLLGAAYTYAAADNFIVENGSLFLSGIVGPVRGPLYAAWNYFMDWQGAYTTNILLFTIMPFSRFGLNGFRAVMILLSLFFLSSLYFMVHAVVNYSQTSESENDRHGCRNKKLFLYTVLLFAALGLPETWIGKEVYYWYTAALGYLAGISGLFISTGCFPSFCLHLFWGEGGSRQTPSHVFWRLFVIFRYILLFIPVHQ